MARRQRDYRAEYIARNKRSQERYGVTYNQQRRAIARSSAPASVVRDIIARAHTEGRNPIAVVGEADRLGKFISDNAGSQDKARRRQVGEAYSDLDDLVGEDNVEDFINYSGE